LGFEGMDVLADFRPQWHHIFPKKYLEGNSKTELTDALGNIAVIGPTINIRISAKAPLDYIVRYKITTEKLDQQLIEADFAETAPTAFDTWVKHRAERLASRSNAFLQELMGGE
jgi:hypothetical protein